MAIKIDLGSDHTEYNFDDMYVIGITENQQKKSIWKKIKELFVFKRNKTDDDEVLKDLGLDGLG